MKLSLMAVAFAAAASQGHAACPTLATKEELAQMKMFVNVLMVGLEEIVVVAHVLMGYHGAQ